MARRSVVRQSSATQWNLGVLVGLESGNCAEEDEDMSDAEEDCVEFDFGVERINIVVHT